MSTEQYGMNKILEILARGLRWLSFNPACLFALGRCCADSMDYRQHNGPPMSLARIDPSVTTLLAVLMTGKVVQKFGEKQDCSQNALPVSGTGSLPATTVVSLPNPLLPTGGKPNI